jgi:hypothetical protein
LTSIKHSDVQVIYYNKMLGCDTRGGQVHDDRYDVQLSSFKLSEFINSLTLSCIYTVENGVVLQIPYNANAHPPLPAQPGGAF